MILGVEQDWLHDIRCRKRSWNILCYPVSRSWLHDPYFISSCRTFLQHKTQPWFFTLKTKLQSPFPNFEELLTPKRASFILDCLIQQFISLPSKLKFSVYLLLGNILEGRNFVSSVLICFFLYVLTDVKITSLLYSSIRSIQHSQADGNYATQFYFRFIRTITMWKHNDYSRTKSNILIFLLEWWELGRSWATVIQCMIIF